MTRRRTCALVMCAAVVCGYALDANAAVQSHGVLDQVLTRYSKAAAAWAQVITNAATWLFWTLATISMVWTFGMLALRKADPGEFLAEFFRFSMFTGFYFWLLTNGPVFAMSIFQSMNQLATRASGLNAELSPSGVMDVGFAIFRQVGNNWTLWAPIDGAVGAALAIGILLVLALVAVNMLLLLIYAWVLSYAGIFFLGFGGSRWTSELAVNYFRSVLGVATQLFTMVLVVGIGQTFLNDYYAQMNTAGIHLNDMAVIAVVAVLLLYLSNKLPAMVAGIVTGAALQPAGGLGVESALNLASAGAALGVAAVSGGVSVAATAGGAGKALGAAVSTAARAVDVGRDIFGSGVGAAGGSAGAEDAADRSRSGRMGPSPFPGPAGSTPIEGPSGAARVVRIGFQAGVNLAAGAGRTMGNALKDRTVETTGAKIADAIRERAERGGASEVRASAGEQGDGEA